MKAKKAKEQLLAIALLSSVFVFFIYLKTNPEINVSSNNQNQVNKIINDKVQEINHEMTNAIDEEIVTEEIMVEENNQITKTEESIILFTERELKRAKAYIDKDWRPDETINMAAWDYVSKNPSINNSKDDNTTFLSNVIDQSDEQNIGETIEKIIIIKPFDDKSQYET